jgi:integrase
LTGGFASLKRRLLVLLDTVMLASSSTSAATFSPALYEVFADGEGLRLSAGCPEGHALVVELMERLGWFTHPPVPSPRPRSDYADHANLRFTDRSQGAIAPPSPTAPIPPPSPSPQESSMLLSALIETHLKNLRRDHQKATPPDRDRAYALRLLLKVIGDKPIQDITPDDANTFADVLAVWPTRLAHNHPEFRDLPPLVIADRSKREKWPVIMRSTQHKHIMGINAFFNWLIKSKRLSENPFGLIDPARYHDPVQRKKDPFTTQDLEALFDADRMKSYTEPHKYWVPLIAYFSGMRVNEISQLYVDDIQSETVVDEKGQRHTLPYFDITPYREGQSIKTPYSLRKVPIHSTLLALGFQQYVADVRASGSQHLFPGLPWEEGGPGRVASRWFNQQLLRNACGIRDKQKTLHCFRHTLTTLAERARISEAIVRTINGHSDGRGIEKCSYVARGSLLECHRVLEGLEFAHRPTTPYVSKQFEAYLEHAAAQKDHEERLIQENKPITRRKGRPSHQKAMLMLEGP